MARCKDCYHYEICSKQSRMVQIDEHTWDTYEEVLEGVEKLCEHFIADVVPRGEFAREIIAEVRQALLNMVLANAMGETYDLENFFAELKKKYTEGE